jgi:DtxR family Mn-dependent transcriptional regulator
MIAQMKMPGLTRSTEDYLKVIYMIEERGSPAQTSAIAEEMDIAPPSVSGMVKRLSESGLLEHTPYHGVQLTGSGRRIALRIVRRHRILETYLTSKLGYEWDSVHEEAERLEHAVSDELVERMAMALGNPQYDPHGAPIPTKDGLMEAREYTPLSEIPVGGMAELREVSDRDPEMLRFLSSLGLKPGVSFEVVGRQPFDGPVTIRLPGSPPRDQVVGNALAQALRCSELTKEVG